MKRFKFLDRIVTADVAFEAYGKDLDELFENAALALFETMVNPKSVVNNQSLTIGLQSGSLEDLLFDFLDQLIFLKDTKGMVFGEFKVKVSGRYQLHAEVFGEKVKPGHQLKTDVKGVALHRFKMEKTKRGYQARVVLDV
jgi:SHS2 domain-containing protein